VAPGRMQSLAEVSHAFAATTTNYQLLLAKVARVTCDLVGDVCLVTLVHADGEHLVNAASAHRDPAAAEVYLAHERQLPVVSARSTSITAQVIATGKVVSGDVDPAELVRRASPALKPIVAAINAYSFAIVPIRAHGAVIGSLTLYRNEPGRSYTEEDLQFLRDIADRAGLAIDNARLYVDLEGRVRQRTAELEMFSAAVAHDLRAPLRSLMAFSDALHEDAGAELSATGRSHLERIRGAAARMHEILDALLQLARITATELRPTHVDVSALADGIVARLREEQPRDVEVHVEPGIDVVADRKLLELALTNLFTNAWKFTRMTASARIAFSIDRTTVPAELVVEDNGVGLPFDRAEGLFRPFYRFHDPETFEGLGIGLAIVRQVVEHHGGTIRAEASAGGGATFRFALAQARAFVQTSV